MSHEKKGGKAIVILRDRNIKDYKTYQKSDKGIVNTQKSVKVLVGSIWAVNNSDDRIATFTFILAISKQKPLLP